MAVLVVEDDRALSTLLGAVLRRFGAEVVLVTRGDTALDAIRNRPWDAVVLDLMLPGLGGAEILRSLRGTHPHLLGRVIVLTAASRAVLDRFEFEPLIWALLRKPFDVEELTEEVRDCISCNAADLTLRPPLADWLARRARGLGARAGLIASAAGQSLELFAEFGFSEGRAASSFPLLRDREYPICAALRRDEPVLLGTIKTARAEFPSILPLWTEDGGQAIAAVRVGESASLGLSFGRAQAFGDAHREALARIARECAAMMGAV